ncbi:MAG: hydrogenobyrinic acid a,c-diamide synthase (glutamine-hydrolyzing) [Nitrospirae bacterium]|nr:hydrogenobyrinic acid a,c-diamide synthase (glutamine-hydrolyzing) [Nitrospirota bacterium]
MDCPRLTIAGLGGDTGKTVISVGLCHFWQKQGYKVTPFKKGPDYIDMSWLNYGANHPCYNIDLFLMNKEQVLSSFSHHTKNSDIAVIEGNRGLYDGMDETGSVSTAEIAKVLKSPVVLVVDCTKVTRTVAALVLGCQMLDPEVLIEGVILNKLAGLRHETIIRKSIENYCHLPVIGAIPRLKDVQFPGRHLGLVPPQEHPVAEEAINTASHIVRKYLDLEKLWEIANEAAPLGVTPPPIPPPRGGRAREGVRIGVIRDSAFQFYYQENLDALKRSGAKLSEFSALKDDFPSDIDGLYIGGGFPETHAEILSSNEKLRRAIRQAAEDGLPIYAECGGLMYLADGLIWNGKNYPMVGVLPIIIAVSKKPRGHGYTIVEVDTPNPYFKTGQVMNGHEFHYSHVVEIKGRTDTYFSFRMRKGTGIMDEMDGLCYKNVLATYTHLHALGTKEWTYGMINTTQTYKKHKIITLG